MIPFMFFCWNTKSSAFEWSVADFIKLPVLFFIIIGDIFSGKSGSGGGLRR